MVIGLDCAAPELIFDQWLDDLPNLKALYDHGLHGFLDGDGFRHFFFVDDFHAGKFSDHGRGLRLRLVVAEVIARTDVNHADREWTGG